MSGVSGEIMLNTKIAVAALVTLLAAGCVSEPVREMPVGPTATLSGSSVKHGYRGWDSFRMSDDTLTLMEKRYRDPQKGWYLTAGQPITLTIIGYRRYEIPIVQLVSAIYEVSGTTTFTPVADHAYLIKGELNEKHSAVWIEDKATGEVVGKKIEVQGSTALGVLEK